MMIAILWWHQVLDTIHLLKLLRDEREKGTERERVMRQLVF